MTRFEIVPAQSTVWIEAESSVHPVHGESTGLQGHIEATLEEGQLDTSNTPAFRITLPVEELKSGNRLQDREMARRVDAKKYPTIDGGSTDVKHLEGDRYLVRGNLTFHGVTREVEGEVRITQPDAATIVIEGEQVFDIRDFDVKPPKILTLKVHPEVNVRVKVIARSAG